MNGLEWRYIHGAHYFSINPILAKMGGRKSINHMESTTLFYKMMNMSLIFLRNYKCSNIFLIINKRTKVKTCIFPFFSLCKPNKENIKFSHFLLSFLSFIRSPNTSEGNIFSSLSFLFLLHSSFPFPFS